MPESDARSVAPATSKTRLPAVTDCKSYEPRQELSTEYSSIRQSHWTVLVISERQGEEVSRQVYWRGPKSQEIAVRVRNATLSPAERRHCFVKMDNDVSFYFVCGWNTHKQDGTDINHNF